MVPSSCHRGPWCQLPSALCQARGAQSWPPRSSGCHSQLPRSAWASLPAGTQLSPEPSVALSLCSGPSLAAELG